MKKLFLSFILPGYLFCIAAACSDTNKSSVSDVARKTPAATTASLEKTRHCTLQSSSMGSGNNKMKSAYSYEGQKLRQILSTRDNQTFTTLFTYDPQGRIDSVRQTSGKSFFKYMYAEDGKLQKIDAGGYYMPRLFSYNDKGQIIRQQTLFNGKVHSSMEYGYDQQGLPVALTVVDKDGQQEYTVRFKYDGKPNPAINTSALSNVLELLYGYPVGNAQHNITEAVTTYHKKQNYIVNGKQPEAGMEEKIVYSYTYNTEGYPLTISSKDEPLSWVYTCR